MNPIPSDAPAVLEDEEIRCRPPMIPAWATPAALLVLLAPTLEWFVRRLDDGSEEPLGLLSLAAAAVFALRERGNGGTSSASRWTGSTFFLVCRLRYSYAKSGSSRILRAWDARFENLR